MSLWLQWVTYNGQKTVELSVQGRFQVPTNNDKGYGFQWELKVLESSMKKVCVFLITRSIAFKLGAKK